jgi:hypothetical protein
MKHYKKDEFFNPKLGEVFKIFDRKQTYTPCINTKADKGCSDCALAFKGCPGIYCKMHIFDRRMILKEVVSNIYSEEENKEIDSDIISCRS